jgi:hypothetical protein
LINTRHAAPVPCHDHVVLKATSQGHGTARHWHGMCEIVSGFQRRPVGDLPRSVSSDHHAEFHEGCYHKLTNTLNCRAISSDISDYHEDFDEGHGTVGEWQGHGMTCVN